MSRPSSRSALGLALPVLAALVGLSPAGCRRDMQDQPRYEPLEASDFFGDGRSARPRVPGTVARGERVNDDLLHTGRSGGEVAVVFPFPVTRAVLARGQERYDIFCAPCHDRTGRGRGMVVQRGFPAPPSLHEPRLREAPPGRIFEVISQGSGNMSGQAAQVGVRDRWAIVAYVRALQRSQDATTADVPAVDRAGLDHTAEGAP